MLFPLQLMAQEWHIECDQQERVQRPLAIMDNTARTLLLTDGETKFISLDKLLQKKRATMEAEVSKQVTETLDIRAYS